MPGTFGNVWRHLWLSQLGWGQGGDAPDIWWVEARDAAEPRTVHRIAPPSPRQITVQPQMSIMLRSRDSALFSSSCSPDHGPAGASRRLAFSTRLQGLAKRAAVRLALPVHLACTSNVSQHQCFCQAALGAAASPGCQPPLLPLTFCPLLHQMFENFLCARPCSRCR